MNTEINEAKSWLKNIAIAILGFIILGLSIKSCSKDNEINELKLDKADIEQRFIETIKLDSTRNYEQNQLIASKDVAIKMLGEEAKRFKSISQVTKVVVKVEKDTILAEYTNTDTIYKAVPIGTEFSYETKWDTIQGKVDSTGIQITKNVTNLGELTTVVGYKKQGFFKKSKPVVQVITENPNVRITGMSNVLVEQKKPKRLAWFGSGVVVGFIAALFVN